MYADSMHVQGPPGFDGANGRNGRPGENGVNGQPGRQGSPGPMGPTGMSHVELCSMHTYVCMYVNALLTGPMRPTCMLCECMRGVSDMQCISVCMHC